ncbi:MAG: hypothetical protein V7754_10840 [Halioglobus sp.]
MHELKRRAYLDAMGIATYISRGPVPGAASTAKLVVVRSLEGQAEPTPQVAGTAPANDVVAPANQMPRIDLQAVPKRVRAENTEKRPAGKASKNATAVEFCMAAFVGGGRLWLEEMPIQSAIMRDQLALLQSISRVLGWGNDTPKTSQFNWPIHSSSQLDQGEEAARAGLGGFVNRKLEKEGCLGVVLLGSGSQRWLTSEQQSDDRYISTVSTAEMLRNPQLKKQAWRDLESFARPG